MGMNQHADGQDGGGSAAGSSEFTSSFKSMSVVADALSVFRSAGQFPGIESLTSSSILGDTFASALKGVVEMPDLAWVGLGSSVVADALSVVRSAGQFPGIAHMLENVDRTTFDSLVKSIREENNLVYTKELEKQFSTFPDSEALLTHSATELDLTVPFGHDPAIRAALQIIITAFLSLSILYMVIHVPIWPIITGVLGSPTPKLTWCATGKAYDKLYDKKHYHPTKKQLPPAPPEGGHPRRRSPGAW
ncbi:hypothetical protein [Arthrobacter sp. RIT-PI-e]|uniref:hypothetical protein n=1 Tax=Arthrobacter sp. RIT-PI-e TaxID=1681197 RepID=UPI00128E9FFE|nr:hypothetical protein [Arthrobacter sp. RIT-PI-e]